MLYIRPSEALAGIERTHFQITSVTRIIYSQILNYENSNRHSNSWCNAHLL